MIRTIALATVLATAVALPAIAEDSKTTSTIQKAAGLLLTSQEAEAWIGKPVYSSDEKKLGEVAGFQRASDNAISEMHADIGGFFGLGEHRVRLMASQISLQSDRVVVALTAAQAKELSTIAK
jgi:hypothetical protein